MMLKANRRLLGIHALWMIGGMFLSLLALLVTEWFFIGVLILMIVVDAMTHRVRCNNCNWPLIKRWWGYALIAPKNCPKCGEVVI